ncbi:hypothetical protein DUNSADRAFT_11010 [Dunaliella salina]|uniref:Uncharacterized protein n=2 Tax=Dunaliella salina TaxID=3046 RepID=A0ABQ7GE92_DUNSA|nr:hypothetical protein DUNSADRAFT_11010 [Dunaliella salina]|eukprot:KAF5832931.1 hypothetical protein DUNSADRAFT_11010 [Dunaliella salina]
MLAHSPMQRDTQTAWQQTLFVVLLLVKFFTLLLGSLLDAASQTDGMAFNTFFHSATFPLNRCFTSLLVQQATQTATYQKAEQAAKQATQDAMRAYYAAGHAVRERASNTVGALSAAKEDLAHAVHDAQQAMGQLVLGAEKDSAHVMQQEGEAVWESAVRAAAGVQEAAEALRQQVAKGQGAAVEAGGFRSIWSRASQTFTSASRWLVHIKQRIWSKLSGAPSRLSNQEPVVEAKQAILKAAQSAKQATIEATNATAQTVSDAAQAAADAQHAAASTLTAAKPQAGQAAQVVSDTAQTMAQRAAGAAHQAAHTATDAAHAAAHTVTDAAHAATHTASDAAHAAANAYHTAQPAAKQAALNALHTAKAAEAAAESAARRASQAASDAYHTTEPVAKKAALETLHAAQASAGAAAAAASHALEHAQHVVQETPHAARELLRALGGTSHDVYERARNILAAVYTSPMLRALVHSAAAGSKAAAADCRDACRSLSAGAAHLSKEALNASIHVGKDLGCAACQAEQDLWAMIEQVAAGLHRVGEEVHRGAQNVRHAVEA